MNSPRPINPIPPARTIGSKFASMNIQVIIPRRGNTGNLPQFKGTLNLRFKFGDLYLSAINDAFTTINAENTAKFVSSATSVISPIIENADANINTAIIAIQGVRLFL